MRGFSLIELLVALAIGTFLIAGAVQMQSQTRKTFMVNEAQARLQETARYTLSVLEPELQMAGLYGFTNQPTMTYVIGGATYSTSDLRTSAPAIAGMPAVLETCGRNFAVDVMQPVQAANGAGYACTSGGGGHYSNSDTLTIRHTEMDPATVSASRLQVYTNRLNDAANQFFIGNAAPGTLTTNITEVRNMVVGTYYVATNSDARAGLPALRLKQLSTDGTSPVYTDQEIIRGVEDLQVEFAVDPGRDEDHDGVVDMTLVPGVADSVDGETGRWVLPGDAILTQGQVSAVRIWVRVRAEDVEQGFRNTRPLTYAGITFTPNDSYRRVLMSRTIFLRNSRQWSRTAS